MPPAPPVPQDRPAHASAGKCFINAARGFAVLFALAATALPASAATRVPVAELEQVLAAGHGLPDAALAQKLSDLELTERLSQSTLARLQPELPGPQSEQELSILTAQSSFLELPPSEIPSTSAPDFARQRQIMALVVNYVTQTINKLPDFSATRETRSFEDRPAIEYSYLPLHPTNQFIVSVLYEDGKEVDRNAAGKKASTPGGLVSWGEFGPILTTVLLDAAKSQLAWSHWEQGVSGPVAVFRYAVPDQKSHYQVQMCGQDGSCAPTQTGYHGEITADPTSGAILRLTAIADLVPGSTLEHNTGLTSGSIMVEYGPVSIGGNSYICPVRSVAIAQVRKTQLQHGVIVAEAMDHSPKLTMLNAVTFTHYHVYRGESRILSEAEAAQMAGKPGDSASMAAPAPPVESAPAAQTAPNTAQTAPLAAPAAAAPASAPPPPAASPAPGAQSQPTVAASAPPQPAPQNPASPANSANSANSASIPAFHTTARQVLVDVIVDKKNGDPVPSLPQSDFSIAEDGKPQNIDFFEEHSADASAPLAQPAMPPLPPAAVTNVPTAPPAAALYVFLLDSLNTEPQDQVVIHQQVLSFLHTLDPGTQIAVFSLGSNLRLLQGFSSDPAALLAAVGRTEAQRDVMAQNRSDNTDDAAHIQNLQMMRAGGAGIEALQAADANANAYSFGTRVSMTFEALSALARYLEGIPGRKNLVWFASSFPVVFFPTPNQIKQLRNSPGIPGYMNHVQQTANLFTLSKISVYPVSGAGLAPSNFDTADSPGSGRGGGRRDNAQLAGESLNSASAHTNMEQLASSTGGRAFTTNDIDSALHRIVHDSATYYTLGYAPTDARTDNGFRRIEVSVNPGKYKLSYRQGYNDDGAASGSDGAGGSAPAENPIAPLLYPGLPSATGILYGVTIEQVPPVSTLKPGSDAAVPPVSTLKPGSDAAAQTTPAGQNPNLHGPTTRYSVHFTIRSQDVALDQAPNGVRAARLLIGLKGYGQTGAALNWQATREAIELTPAQYDEILKAGIPVDLDIDLPAQTPARLVTAVYDWNTGRAGTLEIPIPPPPANKPLSK